jgi:glycosyltransferase involved in cell wall biosynthesis
MIPANFKTDTIPVNPKEITWIIHMYPPIHNAGAEWMAHSMNTYLVAAGWTVNVLLPTFPITTYEGVHIYTFHDPRVPTILARSKLILSHLDYSEKAVRTAKDLDTPVVLIMHNWAQKLYLKKYETMYDKNKIFLVHNSEWIKHLYDYMGFQSIIVYPPVDWRDYKVTTTHTYVTLINLNENKGGDLLIDVAKQMPHVQFLGVIGAYGNQIIDRTIPNITYVPSTPDIKTIYAKTDILLVPSKKESWGRVAVEAMASGIPVVANPTDGLKEALGNAGLFVDRDRVDGWVEAIQKLKSNRTYYRSLSQMASKRSQELAPATQLAAFNLWLEEIPLRAV